MLNMQIGQWSPRAIVIVIDVNSSIEREREKTAVVQTDSEVWTWHHPPADLYVHGEARNGVNNVFKTGYYSRGTVFFDGI